MSVVTFWNGTDEQCGTTSSAMAFATQVSMEHNIKVLLLSTSLNDTIIKDSFWKEKTKKSLGFFSARNVNIDNNGIEGLDRVIRSNKISPEMITDYTKIILKGRLEILLGVEGTEEQYNLIKERYHQVVSLAAKYYDLVVVDLSKKLGIQTEIDILKNSDIVIAMTSQRAKQIQKVQKIINERDILREENTVMTIGKYMPDTKYNIKNITRNLLRKKDLINAIPYNNLFFEASQEGTVTDLFFSFMKIKEKDANYNFVYEIKRLYEMVKVKIDMLQMNKVR